MVIPYLGIGGYTGIPSLDIDGYTGKPYLGIDGYTGIPYLGIGPLTCKSRCLITFNTILIPSVFTNI